MFIIGATLSMSAENSYAITFTTKDGNDNTTPVQTTDLNTAANIESGSEYMGTVTVATRIYPHCSNGLKFGSSNGPGELSFNLAENVKGLKVTRIVLTCTKYKSDTGTFSINGTSVGTPPETEGTLELKYDTPTLIDHIEIKTSKNRAYVREITVYYQDETEPLGEPAVSVNGINLDINANGEVAATVPAMNGTEKSRLTVSCPNATAISSLEGTDYNGDVCTIPIDFDNKGEAIYFFTATNGTESKEVSVDLRKLGIPVLNDGSADVSGNDIAVPAESLYLVEASNATNITATKDGNVFQLEEDNMITFTEGGTYVFTAHAGEFSTVATYTVRIINTNTPGVPTVMLNGTTLENGSACTALLNSSVSITCTDATALWINGANGGDIIPSDHGTFKITKPGEYVFYGENETAPEGKREGEQLTINFNLNLNTPEIHINGEKVNDFSAVIMQTGGGEVELIATDAENNNAIVKFDYRIGEGEIRTVEGNRLSITDPGTFSYTFTPYSEVEGVSIDPFTATITVPEPPQQEIYKRITDTSLLHDGARIIILSETHGQAAGGSTDGRMNAVDITVRNGEWVYDSTTGVNVFELRLIEGSETPLYNLTCNNMNIEASDKSTGLNYKAPTTEKNQQFSIGFDANGAIIKSPVSARQIYSYQSGSTKDFRFYTNKNGEYIQIYMLQEAPALPTLTLNGEAVTDMTNPISVKVGDKAVFESKGATSIVVNTVENPGESYTVTFSEEGFIADYAVTGKNDVGESEPLNVTFALDLTPAAPTVAIAGQPVSGDVTVVPSDVMTVTAAEGTTLIYTKGGAEETICAGNTFQYEFTAADYNLNDAGTVADTPTQYTFKARKGEKESEPVTLNIIVSEPPVPTNVYRLVTSQADIKDGKKYLLVANDVNKAASNNYTGSQINTTDAVITHNTITATADMMVLELEWQPATRNWRIKTDNISGSTDYKYMYVEATAGISFNALSGNVDPFKITVNDNNTVEIRRDVTGTSRLILYSTTSDCFKNYAESNRGDKNYLEVQLYVQDEAGLRADGFEAFQQQCSLHPGKEVKFVTPLTILAHYGNEIWMKDQNGVHVYAGYTGFDDFHMNELAANRSFWNFSGKGKTLSVADDAPLYVEITSIDHEYEIELKGVSGKVPYMRQLDGTLEIPTFSAEPAWWEFGQMEGTLNIVDGKATFTSGARTYNVLTALATTPASEDPELTGRRRYDGNSEWEPGDNSFFNGTREYSNAHIAGTIMPDENGDKGILAMRVSGNVITGVETLDADDPEALVDVYNMQGICLRSGIRRADALRGLPAGIYVAGGRKVVVTQ